jgi:glycosyltransferase involved in cell wall biosynthesis
MGHDAPLVSVCIVTGRRRRLLEVCLESLSAQVDAPPFELLVCADADHDVAAAVHAWFPDARVALVDKSLPGAARNLLVERARGELLLFLDDDVLFEPHLLRRLADVAAAHPEAAVFGGPNLNPPLGSTFQTVQGAVLASLVATGPVRRRYGEHPPGPADERFFVLCNMAVRREAMLPFANDLLCAEENALLVEMRRRRLPMRYDPGLVVYHERRGTYRGFARQMFKYGRGRGQVLTRQAGSVRAAYLLPPVWLACLVLLPALALATPLAFVPLALYLLAVLLGAAKVAHSLGRPLVLPLAAILVVSVHTCYGAGIYAGVLRRRRAPTAPVPAWIEATGAPALKVSEPG